MKTLKSQLKTLMIVLALSLFTNVHAQNGDINNTMYVRVYNLQGKKMGKGKIFNVTDTLLILKKNSKFLNIKPMDIGFIKTKRSGGYNVLMGSIIGGTSMAILGAATADPNDWILGYTSAEGAVGGAIIGAATGASVGGITILFKNSKSFKINGENQNWKSLVSILNK